CRHGFAGVFHAVSATALFMQNLAMDGANELYIHKKFDTGVSDFDGLNLYSVLMPWVALRRHWQSQHLSLKSPTDQGLWGFFVS
ncbi:hypothetical protein, partial [Pseudomonas sp.]|uniref:hypothetical protein n=1 Tax=Pseudomonas sp. TaxID=306 RepID=UPI003D0DB51F